MTTKPHDSARVMEQLAPAYGLRYAALPPPRKWCLISEGPSSTGTISPPPAAPHRAFFGDPASLDAVQYASQNPPAPPVLLPAGPGPTFPLRGCLAATRRSKPALLGAGTPPSLTYPFFVSSGSGSG